MLKNIETGGSTTVDQTEMDEESAKLFPIQTQDEVWKREDKLKEEDVADNMVIIHIFINFKGKFTSFLPFNFYYMYLDQLVYEDFYNFIKFLDK